MNHLQEENKIPISFCAVSRLHLYSSTTTASGKTLDILTTLDFTSTNLELVLYVVLLVTVLSENRLQTSRWDIRAENLRMISGISHVLSLGQ